MSTVTLIAYTPQPERVISASAKLCYTDNSAVNLMEGLTDEKTTTFLEMLNDIGHQSPIEHSYFTFGIEGVSRTLLAQITRHRIASFSVQSQRYVKKSNFVYVTPPAIANDEKTLKIFKESMENAFNDYNTLADILQGKYFREYLSQGMTEREATSKAEKKAIEDARYVLPNACETKMVVSMNARSLMNFFSLRCCNRAQWEIKEVADKMLRLCIEVAPTLFKYAGPSCVNSICPEGKKSCGKCSEVREYYKELKSIKDE